MSDSTPRRDEIFCVDCGAGSYSVPIWLEELLCLPCRQERRAADDD